MNAGQQTPEAKPPESTPETLRHAASAPDGTAPTTGSPTPTGRMVSTRDAVHDVVFLCLVVAASLVLYIRGLGLYSDDWGHLQLMVNSPDHSFLGMLRVFYTEGWAISSRPLQAVYLTGLYSVFGINPFAFHLVNATVFVTAIALFYVSLVELGLPRALALTPPLVYALLPHYSAMRFWYAAFQGNLSMLLLFLSFLACLRTVRSERRSGALTWAAVAIAALICSTLAYEVGAPLFLVIAVLTWRASRRTNGYIGPQGTLGLLAAYIASLVVVGVVKASTTVRGPSHGYVHQMLAFDVAKNLREGAAIHFGTYGAGLPLTALRLVAEYPNTKIAVCGALLGLAIFAYVFGIVWKDPASVAGARRSLKTIGAGLGLFALGFAVFVGFSDIPFTAMGITNRLAIAATVGTAVALIGVIGLISSIVPGGLVRAVVYSAGIAIVCGSGFLVINTEATFWVTAYQREREVVADIQARFPNLAPGTTIVLDGVCPYLGPAIVFDSSWDLACALRIAYADPSVDADVVRQSIEVKDTMLYAWSLGWRTDRPYGDSLFVYDYNSKTIYPLRDAAAARAYFKQSHMTCPPGEEGVGVRLF